MTQLAFQHDRESKFMKSSSRDKMAKFKNMEKEYKKLQQQVDVERRKLDRVVVCKKASQRHLFWLIYRRKNRGHSQTGCHTRND